MKPGNLTVNGVSRAWNDAARKGEASPFSLLGDLLDDFRLRSHTNKEKMALVEEEPDWAGPDSKPDCNAYWAAVVETLCREAGLVPPAWTELPRCYLKHPWFAGGLEDLKAILLTVSPVPFRRRNLFVSANALVRV
jgi:hypothetical protein